MNKACRRIVLDHFHQIVSEHYLAGSDRHVTADPKGFGADRRLTCKLPVKVLRPVGHPAQEVATALPWVRWRITGFIQSMLVGAYTPVSWGIMKRISVS
jgi:hypothetical protein